MKRLNSPRVLWLTMAFILAVWAASAQPAAQQGKGPGAVQGVRPGGPGGPGGLGGAAAGRGPSAFGKSPAGADMMRAAFTKQFEKMDKNGDKKVTLEEFLDAQKESFQNWDTNKDGVLTSEEWTMGFRQSMRPEGAPGAPGEAAASAGSAGSRMALWLWAMDADKDGQITKAEFKGTPDLFAKFDKNADGALDKQEIAAVTGGADPMQEIEKALKAKDKDGDGKLSREEFGGPQNIFDEADTNADGFLSAQELTDAARNNPRIQQILGIGMGGGATKPSAGQAKAEDTANRMLEKLDANKDGKLSREEMAGSEELFDQLDTNKDGFVDKDELKQMKGQSVGAEGPRGRKDGMAQGRARQKPGQAGK